MSFCFLICSFMTGMTDMAGDKVVEFLDLVLVKENEPISEASIYFDLDQKGVCLENPGKIVNL